MTEHADLLARYKHLREVALPLNHRLVETLSKNVLDEGGKKLGILKKNVLTFDSEDEIAVLMDYCIHDVRREGMNAVERYLATSPPPAGSDEMLLLQAKRQARYSLIVVEATEPGVGVEVRDLLNGERCFLFDVGFGTTASVGLVLATRILAPEGLHMTGGAALPLGVPGAEREHWVVQELARKAGIANPQQMSPEQSSAFTAATIRYCLRRGAAEHVNYLDPGKLMAVQPGTSIPDSPVERQASWKPRRGQPRPNRNDPCPCGSGRKFRKCCGARS